jgi:ubiquinol-cytochrome c reductase iron-sulfur subunit
MSRLWQWLTAFVLVRLLRRRPPDQEAVTAALIERDAAGATPEDQRIVPPGPPERGAENAVLVLLALAVLFALAFIVVYAEFKPHALPDQLLGICLGGALIWVGAALTVVAKRLVVTEEVEDEYPEEHPEQQREILEIVHESGSRITRKRLLTAAAAGTGGAIGLAAITPALSIGPVWDTGPLDRTPWRRGTRLVDEEARAIRADEIVERTFYTAFPEDADPELIGSPLIVIRVDPAKLRLPAGRASWAPGGILAYSKICTHAGCAVALYRKPTFTPVEPNDALVCPCHYSTFDPFTGGTVTYGPAGRPLPQLPLMIDAEGYLRAAGNFSARVGPGWWNVRSRPT